MHPRIRWALGLALLVTGSATARDLPNYHQAFAASQKSASNSGLRAVNQRLTHTVSASASEPAFGLPTVLNAAYSARAPLPMAHTPVDAAREHLRNNASAYFLKSGDVSQAVVKHVHDTGRGAVIVKFVSRPGDIEVWGEELNVVMDRKLRLVGMTGYISTPDSAATLFAARGASARGSVAAFSLDHSSAVAAAYADLTGTPLGAGAFGENGVLRGDYHGVSLRAGISTPSPLSFPARARQILFHRPGGLEPAYYVEVASPDPSSRALDYYSYVISARDGSVLVRTNLAAHATPFTYRVWADSGGIHQPYISPVGNGETPAPGNAPSPPYVIPPAVARNDVSLVSGPISTGDPWLADNAAETIGNNVHAYTDLGGVDGLTPAPDGPDYTAPTSGPNAFLYDWSDANGANTSEPQNKAAITQLFYMVNWLHDWYYDNGFDEAAGNAQTDNYGRGPPGGDQDPIYAETNDFSGVDNANMWTPADGSPPRMQMYVFDGPSDLTTLTTVPDVGLGTQAQGFFKPMSQGVRNFDTSGAVVRALPHNGCAALTNAADVAGKIVLIDRGTCTFDVKAANGIAAGAIGVLIWNATNGAFGGGFGAPSPDNTVGNIIIDFTHGGALAAAVDAAPAGTPVTAHMSRVTKDLDGALDEGIVAHEWGHYIQHRLIAAGAQDSQQGAGMGEGWSDFHALLFMVREGQDSKPGNENWSGAYGVGNYASFTFNPDERWYGIRRATYSADPAKNHTTFRFIGTAVAGSTVSFPYLGTAADNPAEVHNTGEIWAAMLFDCYVSMLRHHPFAEAQNTMKDYIVASYKATPALPTFVEARDALLQVVAANSADDYDRFGLAFAGRGLGIGAVAPNRGSATNAGVVESFVWGSNYRIQSVALVDGGTDCDGDGILDPGETGAVEVTIRNIGKGTLSGATATASGGGTGLSFPAATATFSDVAAGSLGTVRIPIAMSASASEIGAPIHVSVTAPVDTGGRATQTFDLAAPLSNLDEVATQDLDSFNTAGSNWSILVEPHTQQPPPGTVWFRALGNGDSDDGTTFAALTNVQSEESIMTPPIQVAASGDFVFSFTHLFAPLAGLSATASGVVIEVHDDSAGARWTDIADVTGATITGGYNGTIDMGDPLLGANERNPLEGRDAFTGFNPTLDAGGFGFDPVVINFHTLYAGKTVFIRFVYGSPFDQFDTQWLYEVDDVQVTGVAAHPFLEDVADQKVCVPIPDAGADQEVNEQSTATLHGAAPDLSGGAVTTAWTQVDGPAVTLSSATSLTPTFTAPSVDTDTPLTFRLTATGQNGVRSAVTHVIVKDVGSPPVAHITGAGVTVAPGAVVILNASSSTDPDGDALTYAWSQSAGPAGTFSASTGSIVTFTTGSTAGAVTIGLKATDAKGLSNSTTGALTVQAPPAPKDEGCSSTGSPASAMGLLVVGAFLLLRRRARA